MARIRTVKPEFWSDEKLSRESDCTRLLFLALLSMADDFGRLLDNEKQIEAFVFPEEERSRDTHESLARLCTLRIIRRGSAANGQRVIEIVNWTRHQRVDKASRRGALPEIVSGQALTQARASPPRAPRASLARVSREDLEAERDLDLEKERERERGLTNDADADGEGASTGDRSNTEGARDPLSADPPPSLREFLLRYYATASAERRADVERQLLQVLSPQGCVVSKASKARAYASRATLEAALLACLAPGAVRVPDRAIVILLKKLVSGPANELLPPGLQGREPAQPPARRSGGLSSIGDSIPNLALVRGQDDASQATAALSEQQLDAWIASDPDRLSERDRRVSECLESWPPEMRPRMQRSAQLQVAREMHARHGSLEVGVA
jgi:hypothetical protein